MDGGSYEHHDSNKEDDTCQCSETSTCTSCSSTAALPLPDVGDGESTVGKPPRPRHLSPRELYSALGSRVGNMYLKALILPPLRPHDDINLPRSISISEQSQIWASSCVRYLTNRHQQAHPGGDAGSRWPWAAGGTGGCTGPASEAARAEESKAGFAGVFPRFGTGALAKLGEGVRLGRAKEAATADTGIGRGMQGGQRKVAQHLSLGMNLLILPFI